MAMPVFVFFRQDGVGQTMLAGFRQVRSRQKEWRVTQFKAVHGSVCFGQARLGCGGKNGG